MTTHSPRPRWADVMGGVAAGVVLALASFAAVAGDHGRARGPLDPAYLQECGACHAPFPARLLPAESWQRVMQGLARHHGTDATLDAATAQRISAWLVANAGNRRESPPDDRITRSRWFVHEHDEVPRSAWSRPAVGRPSNCVACHQGADKGAFDEDDVRIPR